MCIWMAYIHVYRFCIWVVYTCILIVYKGGIYMYIMHRGGIYMYIDSTLGWYVHLY